MTNRRLACRLDRWLDGDDRQHDHIANRLGRRRRRRVAGDDQRLGPAPRQRLGSQHAALLEKDFRAVAVGQEARVGKVEKVLPRQSTAQGMQHRQATEARVEDSDGVVIHWLIRSGIDSRFLGTKSAIDLSHTPGSWKVDL